MLLRTCLSFLPSRALPLDELMMRSWPDRFRAISLRSARDGAVCQGPGAPFFGLVLSFSFQKRFPPPSFPNFQPRNDVCETQRDATLPLLARSQLCKAAEQAAPGTDIKRGHLCVINRPSHHSVWYRGLRRRVLHCSLHGRRLLNSIRMRSVVLHGMLPATPFAFSIILQKIGDCRR